MSTKHFSRRAFLQASASTARHSLILLTVPAILTACQEASEALSNNAGFITLGNEEAAGLQAIAARIIPTDETPGATEARVIYFMDNVLGSSRAEVLQPIRAGLSQLQASANQEYGGVSFSELTASQQDALLRAIEDTPFFDTLRYLTIAGMFAQPSYGGNHDKIGWQLIGFEDRHMWQAPYGYYDADYMEKGA